MVTTVWCDRHGQVSGSECWVCVCAEARKEIVLFKGEAARAIAGKTEMRAALLQYMNHDFCECGCENCEGCANDCMVKAAAGEALSSSDPGHDWLEINHEILKEFEKHSPFDGECMGFCWKCRMTRKLSKLLGGVT